MSPEIILQPEEVWDFFLKNKEICNSNLFEIASNKDNGITIYLSADSSGIGYISVDADSVEVYNQEITSREDSERTVRDIYDDYLTDNVIDILSYDENEQADKDEESEIAEREEELNIFVWDFLISVLGDDTRIEDDNILEDMKDHFLEYMYRKHGLDIYRPMVLESEDGTEFFEEFPYKHIEFEDSNNPLYK